MQRVFWPTVALNVALALLMFGACSAMQDAAGETYRAPVECTDAARQELASREGPGVRVSTYGDTSDGVTAEVDLSWVRAGSRRTHHAEATCRMGVRDGSLVVEELVVE